MINIFKLQQNRYFYIFIEGYLSETQRCTFRFGSECKDYLCNWQAAGQTVGVSFFATCTLVCLSSRVINQTLKGTQQVPTSEAGVGRALEDRDSFC